MREPAPNTIELAAQANAEGLESILVGGNAVNLYSYLRTTFDIDLLIREETSAAWKTFFERRGFAVFHATGNLSRMRLTTDPAVTPERSMRSNEVAVEGSMAFPEFDSLSADAGLTNLEAFQLSLKHALALLPSMPAREEWQADNSGQFSIR